MGKKTVSHVRRFAEAEGGQVAVQVLPPPYALLRPFEIVGFEDLPFGTIVHAAGTSALAVLGALTIVLNRWPWVVPTLTLPPGEERMHEALALVSELRHRVMVVPAVLGRGAAEGPEPEPILEAARARRFPPAEELARYVALRLGTLKLFEELAERFDEALNGRTARLEMHVDTLRRHFRRFGPFRDKDWRDLALVMRDLDARATARGAGDVDTRTLGRRVKRLLGLSLGDAEALVGWEWAIEHALRRAGYPARPLVSL